MPTRVCLVGRRQLFRAGLKHILNDDLFEVAAEIDDLTQPLGEAVDCRLFIVDKPADTRDLEAGLKALKSSPRKARVVVLADSMHADDLIRCFATGVDGYLLGEISPAALCESLRLVELGEKVFPSQMVSLLASLPAAVSRAGAAETAAIAAVGPLSEGEARIVGRLALGMPNKVIAHELAITEATVKVHLKNILKKLGVANRTQAAIWAINNGVASPKGDDPRIAA